MSDTVRKKKDPIVVESLDNVIEDPIIVEPVVEHDNTTVCIGKTIGSVTNCRKSTSGLSDLVTTLKMNATCKFNDSQLVNGYLWLHEERGYWIRADQVKI